jgi:hypothetical protein
MMMYRTNNRFSLHKQLPYKQWKMRKRPIAVQAAYAVQLERDMVADRKKDQESACARIAKVSATKAKTTKITETIVKIEAAIVEDLAVIAEDELRTKTATFKQTRLKVKAIQEKNLNEPIPEDDDFDPVAELLAMGFFRKRSIIYVLTLDHNSSYERLGETKRPPCLSLTR